MEKENKIDYFSENGKLYDLSTLDSAKCQKFMQSFKLQTSGFIAVNSFRYGLRLYKYQYIKLSLIGLSQD